MKRKLIRNAVGGLAAFNSLSAIGGGIAMLLGTYQDSVLIEAGGQGRFPLEWLQNTPFSDYTIPALILTTGVGGSSLTAAVLVFTGRDEGVLASVVAGLAMAGFIVGEIVMLKQRISWIEGLYFGLGLAMAGLASSLRMLGRYPQMGKKYGGTVGLTAVGMFGERAGWGIPAGTPQLNITVGGIGMKPGVVDGHITIREYLSLTISLNHELVDGAPAARFTERLKELIESGYGLFDEGRAGAKIAGGKI